MSWKIMKIDYHIHSEFSADSKLIMEALIAKAISNSYIEIAFTDHFDLLPSEIAVYGTPSYRSYSRAVATQQAKNSEIRILKGVELGEYHRCHQLVDEVLSNYSPPDLKIASIHVLPDGKNISEHLTYEITPDVISSYYQENLALVEYGNFDMLGHLGIYKRYLTDEPDESGELLTIKRIFSLLIEKQIGLEVNLSGLRNSYRKLIPAPVYLKLFREMGGELITIGSDSHHLDHFDLHYQEALQILTECGFTYLFRKTEHGWEPLKIDLKQP